jgi:undecaprenyl-diphosphatase
MDITPFFHSIILGIVEGLTEFIPVSSTAHLLIAGTLLKFPSQAALETLSISIQGGAILAVVFHFWNTIWKSGTLFWKIVIAFLPTGIAGILLYPYIRQMLDNNLVIALALIIGGIVLVFIRPIEENRTASTITWKQAFLIGLVQIASFIPGVSRAGSTIIGGTLLKIPRSIIVPFSFLLAIPTILGASVVSVTDVRISGNDWGLIAVGAVVAFITALFTIRFFMNLLTKKPLSWFGWYRIAVGVLVLVFLV